MVYIGKDVLKLMINATNYNTAVLNICTNNLMLNCAKVVDFGAGMGTMSDLLKNRGFKPECIENDDEMYNLLLSKGYNTYKNLEKYKDNSIENVVSFNVLEHIKDDEDVLCQIYKKMKSGARFFLFLPAYSFLYSSFDNSLGHYRRYDKNDIQNKLLKCNFKVEKYFYFDSLGFFFAFFYKIFNKKGTLPEMFIKIYDKFIFPISQLSDKLFNKFFGKNIVFILLKD